MLQVKIHILINSYLAHIDHPNQVDSEIHNGYHNLSTLSNSVFDNIKSFCLCLDPHPTTYHSNMSVQIIVVLDLGTSILQQCKGGLSRTKYVRVHFQFSLRVR